MIQTVDLVKRFGTATVVDRISITVQRGEIYGFLGPNGAGKTTTMRMVLGLLVPDGGDIIIDGERLNPGSVEYRRRIGVVPEKHPRGMWKWMTAGEYLSVFGEFFGVSGMEKKIDASLERLQLSEHRNKRINRFSRGMLQKLSFARAMIHDPDILLLDEPISGLDPIGIRQIRDIILEEQQKGKTIILSSHLLTEIEKFCTRIGIVYRGRLVSEQPTAEVLSLLLADRTYEIDVETVPSGLVEELSELPFVTGAFARSTTLHVSVNRDDDHRKELSRYLFEKGVPPLLMREKTRTLEDAFIAITSNEQPGASS